MASRSIQSILLTGATGLVGSRFVDLCKDNYSISTFGRGSVNFIVNLTSSKEVIKFIQKSDVQAVINFAAYTNVDEAEKEKNDKQGVVYLLNAQLPLWLAKACQNSGKLFYHISTDYVFDGKQNDHPYTEEDKPKPVNSWYSQTKYFGEQNILEGFYNHISVIRISYPYSSLYSRKHDIARVVVKKVRRNEEFFGIYDQKIKPTSVDDIGEALLFLIDKSVIGIYHIAGNFSPYEYITPYEFAQNIVKKLGLNITLIKPISFLELSKKRIAPRPQHTWLSTRKIESLGFKITNMEDALERFRNQLQLQ